MRASFQPTARLARPWLVVATIGLGSLPLVVAIVRSGTDLTMAAVLLGLSAGAALGWTVEDPAAELLAPLPIGAPFRLGLRLAVGGGIACLLVAVMVSTLAVGPTLPGGAADRLPEALAAGSVAVAAGLFAARRGHRSVGAGAVTSGLLTVGLVAALATRWPSHLPAFTPGDVHQRWWWLATAGVVIGARLARDPGRR